MSRLTLPPGEASSSGGLNITVNIYMYVCMRVCVREREFVYQQSKRNLILQAAQLAPPPLFLSRL